MTQFKSFKDMEVWKESRILVREIRAICKQPNVCRDFSFIDQITRAARSVSANIAEGNDSMTTPEFIKFLSYAKRSSAEVQAHLYDALDEQYIDEQKFNRLEAQAIKVCRMLAKLIHYLQSINPEIKRTYRASKPVNS